MADRASIPITPREFLLESLYAGVLGGSAVALFYLVVDLVNGQPLFTPSMIGQVLFQGVSAPDVTEVKLGAVAAFSVVHILAFTGLGGALSFVVHEVELHSRHPIVVLLVLFAIIEAAFFMVVPFLFPGVTAPLAMLRIGGANLLAAGTMALFFVLSHRAGAWEKVKHSTNEILLDSLYAGMLGGTAVAAFFLVMDLADGQPLFTPSLMGSVLFLDVAAQDVTEVNLAAVAYFSLVHIVAFAAFGAAVAFVVDKVELHSARHPVELLLVLFAITETAFFAAAPVVMPGVIARLGIVRVGIANLLAAGSMALFFVLYHRSAAREKVKHNLADFLYDSFFSGAIGGSVVALFFLATDSLNGEPFFTPSLMGSVLFLDIAAKDVEMSLDTVGYFTIAHFAMWAVVGTLVTGLVHEVELHSRHPVALVLVLVAIIEVVFLFVASLAMPGVIARLGIARVGIANLLAAGSMGLFFVLSHREQAWEKIKHAARLA